MIYSQTINTYLTDSDINTTIYIFKKNTIGINITIQ